MLFLVIITGNYSCHFRSGPLDPVGILVCLGNKRLKYRTPCTESSVQLN